MSSKEKKLWLIWIKNSPTVKSIHIIAWFSEALYWLIFYQEQNITSFLTQSAHEIIPKRYEKKQIVVIGLLVNLCLLINLFSFYMTSTFQAIMVFCSLAVFEITFCRVIFLYKMYLGLLFAIPEYSYSAAIDAYRSIFHSYRFDVKWQHNKQESSC